MRRRIGVDLGGTTAKIGLLEEGKITQRITVETGIGIPFEDTVQTLCEAVLSMGEAECVGFGIPSSLLPGSDIIVHANNLGWKNKDIRTECGKYLHLPVYIANDADCALVAEYMCGQAKGCENVLMLTLGTGVGGSFIYKGKLFLGGTGSGFEPGHMTLREDGEPCTCGKRGCLEAYTSSTALIREAGKAPENSLLYTFIIENGGKPNARMVFDAAEQEDPAAKDILDHYLRSLAVGISSLIELFHPEKILLGGGISHASYEMLYAPLKRFVESHTYGKEIMGIPPILPAVLGNDAGIIGAASLREVLSPR